MCGMTILTSMVLFPLAGIGFIFVEQECKAYKQRKKFQQQIDEIDMIARRLRSDYDSH
jgi:Flp pilus assembly protein TadB